MERDIVLDFIETLNGKRDADSGSKILEAVFTLGNCGNFARALKTIFPEGKIYLAKGNDHVMFGHGCHFYDVLGRWKRLVTVDSQGEIVDDEMIEISDQELDEYCDNFSLKEWGPKF
jgi:hypothetical protein